MRTLAESIEQLRRDYPADRFDLIFDEAGRPVGAAPKRRPNEDEAAQPQAADGILGPIPKSEI